MGIRAVGTRWTFFLCEKSYKSTRDRDTHTRSIASVSLFLFLFPSSYSHPSEFALLDENSTGGPLSKMSGDHARRIVFTSFYLLVWFFYWKKLCWTVWRGKFTTICEKFKTPGGGTLSFSSREKRNKVKITKLNKTTNNSNHDKTKSKTTENNNKNIRNVHLQWQFEPGHISAEYMYAQ